MITSAYAIELGSTVLSGLTQLETQNNHNVRADVGIGSLFPQFAVVDGVTPRIPFTSRAVKRVLDSIGTTGTALSDSKQLKVYFATVVDGEVNGTALCYTAKRGLVLPRTLQCSHRGDATISAEALLYSEDGVLAPYVIATVTTLPTLVRDNIRHTIENATVGLDAETTVNLGCVTDVTIDFGVNAETFGCKSDLYDTHVEKGQGVTPNMQITTLEGGLQSQLSLGGKAVTHAITNVRFRQYETDGIGFATDADFRITANGVVTVQGTSGQGPARTQAVVRIDGSWDGTNAPFVLVDDAP